MSALKTEIAAKGVDKVSGIREYIPVSSVLADGTHYQDVILVDNDSASSAAYQIPADCTEGIVVATGNVYVDHSFTGLIISGGKVETDKLKRGTINFADGAVVTSDELMVSKLFADDMALPAPLFSQFFRDCPTGTDAGSVTGNVDMKQYLSYENWKKN